MSFLKNDFPFVFSTEVQAYKYPKKFSIEKSLCTRYMFYDIMHCKNKLI
jgi:hypothetical protein